MRFCGMNVLIECSIYIFLMDNRLCTLLYFIFYVKKFGGFFNICCSFMLCNTHVTAVSVWSIYRYNVISFFDTPLNLTISFVYIFSRGFKQRISSELIDIPFVLMLSWKFFRPITLVRAPMFLVYNVMCISFKQYVLPI